MFLCRPFSTSSRTLAPRIPISTSTLPTTSSALSPSKILPFVPHCPEPTHCPCTPDPTTGSPIDRKTPLINTTPTYNTHILIPTPGETDWPSQIAGAGTLAGRVKKLHLDARLKATAAGKEVGGVLITNTSLAPVEENGGVYLMPQGLHFPEITASCTDERLWEWIDGHVVSSAASNTGGPEVQRRFTRSVVLICSHHSRDERCGNYFPVLERVFREELARAGLRVGVDVEVAATSHLGGHKWAGNVVVYVLSEGWGVWYGRVGVREVEGIVRETVVGKKVVGGGILRGIVGAEVDAAGE